MDGVLIFVLGLVFGSFFNVVIDRLSEDKPLTGRSHCDFCGKTLSAAELVPVLSYFLQNGKSRCCDKKLSLFYPFVEIVTGVTFLIIYKYLGSPTQFPHVINLISYLGIMSSLVVIFFTDLKYQIIPDQVLITLGLFSLPKIPKAEFIPHLSAGVLLTLMLYGIYRLTKKKGLGLGDVKFAFFIGLLLGLSDGFLALYLAFVSGGIFSLILVLIYKKSLKTNIAFGPFIVLGVITMLFFSNAVERAITILFR